MKYKKVGEIIVHFLFLCEIFYFICQLDTSIDEPFFEKHVYRRLSFIYPSTLLFKFFQFLSSPLQKNKFKDNCEERAIGFDGEEIIAKQFFRGRKTRGNIKPLDGGCLLKTSSISPLFKVNPQPVFRWC